MSRISIWTILGLEGPTSDIKAIRSAYAKTLRVTRPDENPDGFMVLRDAFEHAQNYAYSYFDEKDPTEIPAPISRSTIDMPAPNPVNWVSGPHTALRSPEENRFEGICHDLQTLLADTQKRNDAAAWTSLLGQAQSLPLDDYTQFENRLLAALLDLWGYYDPPQKPVKGLKKLLGNRFKQTKISQSIGKLIFVEMGWNRWKLLPADMQVELLWLLYELGLKDKPKTEKSPKQSLWSEARLILIALAIAVVFGLLAKWVEPTPAALPPPLPESGETAYGSYVMNGDRTGWNYETGKGNDAIKALGEGETLTDSFDLQFSEQEITTVTITITGTGGKPELGHTQDSRRLDTKPEAGPHSILYLISGIFGFFAIFRGGGFIIGVILGSIGLIFESGWRSLKRFFSP